MPTLSLLVATWGDGITRLTGSTVGREFAGRSVRGLVADGRGGALAIVDEHVLARRSRTGGWTTIIHSDAPLSCCIASGDVVYLGTSDARILRVDPDGHVGALAGFDAVPGRETWYAGTAIVDGEILGPPLGIRSLAASCDGATLFANVHVGGIPRSTDGGVTWRPTIDIDLDVHQVCAHPTRPDLVIAAAAAGLCTSRDAGATWTVESRGLHATHCSAVAFGTNDIFVSASTDPFATRGALYRRTIDGDDPLEPFGGGMPPWLDGVADTDCIATNDATIAVIDRSGCLYVSYDDGETWASPFERLPEPSGLLIC